MTRPNAQHLILKVHPKSKVKKLFLTSTKNSPMNLLLKIVCQGSYPEEERSIVTRNVSDAKIPEGTRTFSYLNNTFADDVLINIDI